MPKQRITKEMVVEAAFSLAREGGMETVQVKAIAEKLQCSVQPIYGYCNNMEGLKQEVITYTKAYLDQYVSKRIDRENLFESTGRAHAMFAKEEPQLYRLYYLREREGCGSVSEIFQKEGNPAIISYIQKQYCMNEVDAEAFWHHMMVYNIGVSFVLSSLGEHVDIEETMGMQKQVHEALLRFFKKGEEK